MKTLLLMLIMFFLLACTPTWVVIEPDAFPDGLSGESVSALLAGEVPTDPVLLELHNYRPLPVAARQEYIDINDETAAAMVNYLATGDPVQLAKIDYFDLAATLAAFSRP